MKPTQTRIGLLAMLVLLGVTTVEAQTVTRYRMAVRANEHLEIELQTADGPCLNTSLFRSEYQTIPCSGSSPYEAHSSDFAWHSDFYNNNPPYQASWQGTPYGFSGKEHPNQSDWQSRLDNCAGIGYHQCHYNGNNCPYGGCDWAVGVDCSGLVSYAWGLPGSGTCTLANYAVQIPKDQLKLGSILNWCGHHVVFITDSNGTTVDLVELCGDYPVARERFGVNIQPEFNNYTGYDFVHVIDSPGTDGSLFAELRGETVKLQWDVEGATDVVRYDFQYQDETGSWITFHETSYEGPGTYTATYIPDGTDLRELVFRVWERSATGPPTPHGETVALEKRDR